MVRLTDAERRKFIEYAESRNDIWPPTKFTWSDLCTFLRSIATSCPQSVGDDLLPEEPRIEWPADAPKTFAEHLDAALDSGQPPMVALGLAVQRYAEGRR